MLKPQHYYPRFFLFKYYIRRNKYIFKLRKCGIKTIICFYLLKKQYFLFNINKKYIKNFLVIKKENLFFLSKKYLNFFYMYLYKAKKIPQSLWFSPTSLRYNKGFLYKKIYGSKKQITMKAKNSLFLNINNVTGIFRNFFKRSHTKLNFL